MADLVSQWDAEGFGPVQAGLRSQRVQGGIIAETAAQIEAAAMNEMRSATGGDLRLSGWPYGGQTRAATVAVAGSGDTGTIRFQPAGMWALVQEGARPHRIAGKGTRIVTEVRGQFRTGPFRHPGMAPLGNPIGKATDDIESDLEENTDREIERTFT